MIRTFEKKTGNAWNEVVITNTETNDFEQFCYEIISGKLVKFSEYKTTNDSKMFLKDRCKQLGYKEVNNDFLDNYPLWNKEDQTNYRAKKEVI
jgi:hypothetical protein